MRLLPLTTCLCCNPGGGVESYVPVASFIKDGKETIRPLSNVQNVVLVMEDLPMSLLKVKFSK